jgi:L-seryl-tRNA(Ser) seleniumtransferase
MSQDQLRNLPSVDALLQEHTLRDLEHRYGHTLVVEACRAALDAARKTILAGSDAPTPQGGFALPARLIDDICARVERAVHPSLVPVINATGVIIHTNLGRAPLSEETLASMKIAAQGYSNLEYDLDAGERGSRYAHAESLLTRLVGAEAALVVNNNAAAVMLILATFARGKPVVISRGQLVEIGGGFRVPEVMQQSGATLVEVGTTNRTRIEDYARAITEQTAMLLRVHRSNFRIIGFTEDASLDELVALGRERGLMVVDDLGSGALLDTRAYGLMHEPTPQESLAAGIDLVSFSGDKLLGGPQAGIIVGKKSAVDVLKKHPMTRALRVDKVTLAGLQATLLHYLKGEAVKKIPVWTMMAATRDDLDARAKKWAERLRAARLDAVVIDAESTVGGGSLPSETLPTRALAIAVASPDEFAARLRQNIPPIIARIEEQRVVFDPRTVLAAEEDALLAVIERCAKS